MLAEVDKTIDLSNMDKSDWKSYRFDEIAHNISERIDPNNTDLEVYIGLEHIDSESIHIKRFGTRDDVNGQKLRFYPGDVIFGRRRAYQRKAGIAETNGFCSAHALVLRANPNVIDPKLFPFFLHSDAFMHRAIDISVGSLSPTINWGTLKKQEFLIPPIAQQAKLAELLWAMDDVIQNQVRNFGLIEILLLALRKHHFGERSERKIPLSALTSVRAGTGFPMKYQGEKNKGTMFFKVSDMNTASNSRVMSLAEHTVSPEDVIELKGKVHVKGTVVFPKVGAAIATEKKRVLGVDAMLDNNVMGVTTNEPKCLPPDYLLEFMNTISLSGIANAGAVPSINASIVKALEIALPNREVVDDYLCKIDKLISLHNIAECYVDASKALQRNLISRVF